jgi:hypothetical protein
MTTKSGFIGFLSGLIATAILFHPLAIDPPYNQHPAYNL